MRRIVLALGIAACGGSSGGGAIDAAAHDATIADASAPDANSFPATLDGNRDRLIRTYHARLASIPDVMQMNGLTGNALPDVCALWQALSPSARDVFRTLTHRLEGATLPDQSHALDHVQLLYRLDGGDGSSATDPGACGGEGNRMIMSMDPALHDVWVAVNAGTETLADIAPHADWRQSNDAGGPHAPFDQSDETNDGAPRGQTQYFVDPTGAAATAPLGRRDIEDVTDPYALEFDQDYDCVHASNPACDYVFYGPACAPETSLSGDAIYTMNYGDFEPAWAPSGC